jgi:TolB-like protein
MDETIEAFALAASDGVTPIPMPASESPFLAVLPFDNLSDDRDMQFFSDGVAEEILQTVARARGVKVAGRGSSFQFRGPDKATRRVARELGVSHVLDGSVRKAGNRIRVSAHLVDARTEATLWTERYDRDLADVLALQDELAAAIAAALNSTLIHVPQGHKVHPQAYELYLKARAAIASNWLTSEKRQAIASLEQAIGLDPKFARAWGMLALARTTLLPMGRDCVGEPQHAQALSAADNAEATLARAFLMPAFSHHAEKIALARRAASLAPSEAFLLAYAGEFTLAVGRVRDCIAQYAYAVHLDPALQILQAGLAMYTGASGRWDEGCAMMEALYAKHPTSALVWWCLVLAKTEAGKVNEALEMVSPGARLPAEFSRQDADRAAALFRLRTLPDAEKRAAVSAMFMHMGDGPLDLMVCMVAAAIGQHDMAISQMIGAIESGRSIGQSGSGPFGARRASSTGLFFWSHWRSARSDPRFVKLCAHLGLAQYWLASGEWPDCADEVPYDFKAECEKAVHDLARPGRG